MSTVNTDLILFIGNVCEVTRKYVMRNLLKQNGSYEGKNKENSKCFDVTNFMKVEVLKYYFHSIALHCKYTLTNPNRGVFVFFKCPD